MWHPTTFSATKRVPCIVAQPVYPQARETNLSVVWLFCRTCAREHSGPAACGPSFHSPQGARNTLPTMRRKEISSPG